MTFLGFIFLILSLALAVLVGIGIACYRLKGRLKTKSGKPATMGRTLLRALGGGGPGVEE